MAGAFPHSRCWLLLVLAAGPIAEPAAVAAGVTARKVGASHHELIAERSGAATSGVPSERWLPLQLQSFGGSHRPSMVVGVLPRELAPPPVVVLHHDPTPPAPPSTTRAAPTTTTPPPVGAPDEDFRAHLDEARAKRDASERDRLREKLLAGPRTELNGFFGDDVEHSSKAMLTGVKNVAVMQVESARQKQVRNCLSSRGRFFVQYRRPGVLHVSVEASAIAADV